MVLGTVDNCTIGFQHTVIRVVSVSIVSVLVFYTKLVRLVKSTQLGHYFALFIGEGRLILHIHTGAGCHLGLDKTIRNGLDQHIVGYEGRVVVVGHEHIGRAGLGGLAADGLHLEGGAVVAAGLVECAVLAGIHSEGDAHGVHQAFLEVAVILGRLGYEVVGDGIVIAPS